MSSTNTGRKIFAGVSGLVFANAAVHGFRQSQKHAELVRMDGLGYWERRAKEDKECLKILAEARAKREVEHRRLDLGKQRIDRMFGIVQLKKLANEQNRAYIGEPPYSPFSWADLESELYEVVRRREDLETRTIFITTSSPVPHSVVPEQHKSHEAEGTEPSV